MTVNEIAVAMDAVVELKRENKDDVVVLPAEADAESPKSVAKFGRKELAGGLYVHSQVLRVKKEEELLLKEDIDGVNNKERKNNNHNNKKKKNDCCYQEQRHLNFVVFTRPILPCSPLSGRTNNDSTGVQAASN